MSTQADFDILIEKLFEEKATRLTLDNGLTVVVKEDHSADVMSAQVWIKTGSIHEGEHLGSGLSHYVEHMLFKGTTKRKYHEISEDIQKVGANVNAYTSFNRTVYYIDGPAEALEVSLDTLSDIIFNSTFDPKETKREKDVILREIDMGLDNPDNLLSKKFFKTAFKEHPYRQPVIGERELFEQITREQLYTYYKKRYVPSNMTLIIVGAVEVKKLIELANTYFGKAPNKTLEPVYIPEEPLQLAKREEEIFGDVQITRGLQTYKTPGLGHEDSPALSVFANLLGQGQSSHLWQTLREEQNLVHSIDASVWNPAKQGLFFISYTCDADKHEKVKESIQKELDFIAKNGFSKEKVAKTVRQAMVAQVNSKKTISGQASNLGIAEVIVGSLDYPKVYLNLLKKVTPAKVAEVQKTYIVSKGFTATTLSPNSAKTKEKKAKAKAKKLPAFEEITFKNGAKLLLQKVTNLPKISIRTSLLGGPLYETAENAGITGILATMLTKDTEKRTALQVAETMENIGGSFSEFSGNNSFGLSAEVMNFDLATASEILHDALIKPKFTKENFIVERDGQIASIRETNDEITDYSIRQLRQTFFKNHPYQFDSLGTIEALEGISLGDVKKHYQKLLSPENLSVAVSGDFEKEAILKTLGKWIEAIPVSGKFKKENITFDKLPKASKTEEKLDKEQVVVLQAYPGVGITDPKLEVTEVLDELLSGMSSKLFLNIREKQGMAYYIGSSRMIGINTGMFYFYAGTSTENYKKVIKGIDDEIARIQLGKMTTEELDRCKIRLKASHKMGLQTAASRSMDAALNSIYGLPVNNWQTYEKRIDAVTKKDIQDFAKNFLKTSNKVQYLTGALKKKA